MSYLIKNPQELLHFRQFGGHSLFKGGGGGSGQRDATPEERALWQAQADSLTQMNDIAMPSLQAGMNNLGVMANESMDGSLATKLRGTAGADASMALGQAMGQANRNIGRYGMNPNANTLSSNSLTASLEGAKIRTGAMNQATMGAEDLKWQRNAALTGLASGQGNSAVSGMGSLASQIGSNRQAANASDASSTQGLGMMGAYLGSKLFADGGEVKMASGGSLQMFKPTSVSRLSRIGGLSEMDSPKMSTMEKVGAVAAPMAITAVANIAGKVAKPYMDRAADAIANKINGALATSGVQGGAPYAGGIDAVNGSDLASDLAGKTVDGAGSAADGLQAATDISGNTVDLANSATTLTDTASTATPGAGTMLSVGSDFANGDYAKGAMKAGLSTIDPTGGFLANTGTNLLWDAFADGGDVQRQDLTPGGEVSGPGTETSDSIPARLSDGEIVENAEAVKMHPNETKQVIANWSNSGGDTKDLLLAINEAGLQKREQKAGRRNMKVGGICMKRGEAHASLGGFLDTMGMVARGYVPTAMQLDQQDEQKKQREEALGFQKRAEDRAVEDRTYQNTERDRVGELRKQLVANEAARAANAKAVGSGDYSPLNELGKQYGAANNVPGHPLNDGHTMELNGQTYTVLKGDKVVDTGVLTPEKALSGLNSYHDTISRNLWAQIDPVKSVEHRISSTERAAEKASDRQYEGETWTNRNKATHANALELAKVQDERAARREAAAESRQQRSFAQQQKLLEMRLGISEDSAGGSVGTRVRGSGGGDVLKSMEPYDKLSEGIEPPEGADPAGYRDAYRETLARLLPGSYGDKWQAKMTPSQMDEARLAAKKITDASYTKQSGIRMSHDPDNNGNWTRSAVVDGKRWSLGGVDANEVESFHLKGLESGKDLTPEQQKMARSIDTSRLVRVEREAEKLNAAVNDPEYMATLSHEQRGKVQLAADAAQKRHLDALQEFGRKYSVDGRRHDPVQGGAAGGGDFIKRSESRAMPGYSDNYRGTQPAGESESVMTSIANRLSKAGSGFKPMDPNDFNSRVFSRPVNQ